VQVPQVALALPGRQVDDLADVLLADVDEPWRRLERISLAGRPDETLALDPAVGPALPSASTIFLKPSARARFCASLPTLKVSAW
jgi:hypothetical protein